MWCKEICNRMSFGVQWSVYGDTWKLIKCMTEFQILNHIRESDLRKKDLCPLPGFTYCSLWGHSASMDIFLNSATLITRGYGWAN